jgi:hypothetical protein
VIGPKAPCPTRDRHESRRYRVSHGVTGHDPKIVIWRMAVAVVDALPTVLDPSRMRRIRGDPFPMTLAEGEDTDWPVHKPSMAASEAGDDDGPLPESRYR